MAKSYKLHDKLDDLTLYLLTHRQGYVDILLGYMNLRNMSIPRTMIFAKIYSSTQSRLPFNDSHSTPFCWWLRRRFSSQIQVHNHCPIVILRANVLKEIKLRWGKWRRTNNLHPRGKNLTPFCYLYMKFCLKI